MLGIKPTVLCIITPRPGSHTSSTTGSPGRPSPEGGRGTPDLTLGYISRLPRDPKFRPFMIQLLVHINNVQKVLYDPRAQPKGCP